MPAIQESPSAPTASDTTLPDTTASDAFETTQNPDLESEEIEDEETEDEFSPVHLFLEDFVVTSLLSAGKPLRGGELSSRADFQLPRLGLRESLKDSKIVGFEGREWDAIWRASRKGLSREERSRQPIESMIRELLLCVGKPLPIPVIAREVCLMRNQFDANMKDAVANVLKSARFALEVVPGVWLHQDFVLATGAESDERLIKENRLQSDADFEALVEYAEVTKTDAAGIANELMEFTGGPLSQKLIGFFVHRAAPKGFSTQKVAAALNDRAKFQPLLGGFVSLQENLASLRTQVEEFLQSYHSAPLSAEEIQTLLKQRVTPSQVIAPRPDELEELKRLAKNGDGKPLELALVVLDVLEMEKDDPKLVAAFQGLNDALRRDAGAWLPTGIGRFLLRESVPAEVGQIPALLKPLQLETIDPDTREAFDYAMSDEGMEADCAAFIHDPQWEDVGEESEAIFEKTPAPNALRIVILNHHLRAGTLKMRRVDEPFFDLINGLARLSFKTGNNAPILTGWASRDSGLITGLGDWCEENLPPSGGALLLSRAGDQINVEISTPDMGTFLTARRVDELEELRENADELSVYEILRRVLGAHPAGMSLPSIWAEVNAVRRTSKRLMCSVLSGYEELVSKQRGPSQFLWTSDSSKAGGGFSRSKRKFVVK